MTFHTALHTACNALQLTFTPGYVVYYKWRVGYNKMYKFKKLHNYLTCLHNSDIYPITNGKALFMVTMVMEHHKMAVLTLKRWVLGHIAKCGQEIQTAVYILSHNNSTHSVQVQMTATIANRTNWPDNYTIVLSIWKKKKISYIHNRKPLTFQYATLSIGRIILTYCYNLLTVLHYTWHVFIFTVLEPN